MNRSNPRPSGFTIVELLVILAILAIFGALALPALAQDNRGLSRVIQCMDNHRQLIKAWQMYTADSEEYVPNNYTIPGTQAAITKWTTTGICDTWAPNIMDFAVGLGSMSVTNTALAKASLLSPYLGGNIAPFRCPADNFLSKSQKNAGWKCRLRSVSMNSNWGRSDPSEPKRAFNASWVYGAAFRQWHRTGEVRKPAEMYVFVEEHPNSINDGFFILQWGSGSGEYPTTSPGGSWSDIPAFHHNNSSSFAFADGHTEMKRWISRSIPVNPDAPYKTGPVDLRDQQWYVHHVAERW